jgi:uncharacterized protein YndB with AHSA1/START domain
MTRLLALAAVLCLASPALAQPIPRTIAEADGSLTLVHEATIDAPAQDVWKAISTPEGWASWAVPVARIADGDPDLLETSYDPAAPPGGRETIRQLFVARIPGRMLAFRTVKAPARFPDFETYAKVVSVFELVPLGERRTLVRLSGVGYPDSDAGRRLLAFFERGNAASLAMLRERFERGPVNWAEKLGKK